MSKCFRIEITAKANKKINIFCVLTLCSLLKTFRRFGGKHCLHIEGGTYFEYIRRISRHNTSLLFQLMHTIYSTLKHCGRVTQICVFNTVKLGTSASSLSATPQGGMFPEVTPSSTTMVFGEYFLKI